jgi:competence protein ComEC
MAHGHFHIAILSTVIAFSVGMIRTGILPDPHDFRLQNVQTVRIDDFPDQSGPSFYANGRTSPGNHHIILKFNEPPPTYGDVIQIHGHMRPPTPPTNPGQPDISRNLSTRRIAGIITVDQYHPIGKTLRNPIKVIANSLRNHVVSRVQSLLPPPYGDLLIALTLGDAGTAIPEDLTAAYRTAGLTHLLVVSGSQVSLIIGIGTAIIAILSLPILPQTILLTLLNLFFYCLCGGGASILRAVIMSEISLFTQAFDNRTTPLHLIACSILIFLMIDPTLVSNVGAHLSFLATAALIWGVPTIAEALPARWPKKVRHLIAMSLAPFLVTLPILWSQFQAVSLISLIANLVVTPLIEAVVIIGIASEGITAVIPSVGQWALSFCHGLMIIINWIATNAALVPFATLHLAEPPIVVIAGLMIAIAATLIPELFPIPVIKTAVLLGCIGFSLGYVGTTATVAPPLRIVFIDVDQGDSTLIMTPRGKNILIDAGNYIVSRHTGRPVFDAGRERVLPVLNYYGIDHLDWVIVTHFDQDHIGGIPSVIGKIPVTTLFTNGRDALHPQWHFPQKALKESPDDQLIDVEPGVTIHLFNLKTDQLEKENDHSIVTLLRFGQFSAIFTGDLEAIGETILADA